MKKTFIVRMDFVGVVTGYSGDIQDQLLLVPSWYQKVHQSRAKIQLVTAENFLLLHFLHLSRVLRYM